MRFPRFAIALVFLVLLLWIVTIFMGKLLQHNKSWIPTRPLVRHLNIQNRSIQNLNIPNLNIQNLNIQDPTKFSNESDFKCIDIKLDKTQLPMCVYGEQEDIYVSKAFLKGTFFEEKSVLNFVNMLKDHDDFTFVDIGANLGTYSIPLARLGRHVVAVEPNWNTLRRLSKSVFLGGDASKIDILFNAIGNERSTTVLKFDRSNRGHTVLTNNVTCEQNCETLDMSVSIVTLNDLIPIMRHRKAVIKVDTEGSEIDIFTPNGASEFFHSTDVRLIQMEWRFYADLYDNSPEKRQLVDNFVQFFYERNYTVFGKDSGQKLGLKWTNWPGDVIFKKASSTGQLYSV